MLGWDLYDTHTVQQHGRRGRVLEQGYRGTYDGVKVMIKNIPFYT